MEISTQEAERLAALVRYDMLDTDAEESFDRITRIVASMFQAPIALVSLVDQNRQWFKSAVGLTAKQTPREHAFCAHAICGRGVFVVKDATLDTRFSDNPLVVGQPEIRFYAGAPLVTPDDYALGTLCIIDRQSRPEPTPEQKQILTDLADLVMREMETRRILRQNQMVARKAHTALACISDNAARLLKETSRQGIAELVTDTRSALRILDEMETVTRQGD